MARVFGLALLLAVLAASAGAQSLRRFSEGGKWGYLDSTVAVAVPAQFANAYDTWSDGFARVKLDSVKFAYMNARGRVIGALGFDGAMNFSSAGFGAPASGPFCILTVLNTRRFK